MRRKLILLCSVLALAACSGDAGPTGPAGPAGSAGAVGPQGPQGLPGAPAVVAWGTVVIDGAGEGVLTLSGAQVETTVWNCYTSDTNAGPWLLIADGDQTLASTFCGAMNNGGDLQVALVGGIPGWIFLATAVSQ